ncbi:rhodanese-like domain-containing protein [Algicella marina]|uniref:Rhodanese-like domain-containing protein n=1 Tax=Algicella marina TaxID=2683284 RepID=A0A6P1T3K6_9RHOB|nr:rhodanese-like domain-containing protein [Algicella marina]QHQ35869.1 rhodanese-like domain-containing protein [Algicella marina]
MSGKLKTGVAEMVAAAKAKIDEVSAEAALPLANDPETVIVDLRDVRERQRDGWIPGSFHCPRGMAEFWVDPDSPYFKDIFGEDKAFVFHCASGWRSALTVATLQEMGLPRVAHISDGFKGWVAAGGPVERADKA